MMTETEKLESKKWLICMSMVWDEPEETKCDKKALQEEKWANYEYSDEE